MKKHVMAITYAPKEDAVRLGDCRQTIRKGDKVSVGDEILFHGWSGRPYRSPWSWQKRVTVACTMPISLFADDGVQFYVKVYSWRSAIADSLAAEDGILPPTGAALRDVLFGLNTPPSDVPVTYQIIRW